MVLKIVDFKTLTSRWIQVSIFHNGHNGEYYTCQYVFNRIYFQFSIFILASKSWMSETSRECKCLIEIRFLNSSSNTITGLISCIKVSNGSFKNLPDHSFEKNNRFVSSVSIRADWCYEKSSNCFEKFRYSIFISSVNTGMVFSNMAWSKIFTLVI